MADGNASGTMASRETKKKMKAPMPFSGKREDLRKFLQETKIYLLANGDVYPDNIEKVLFVLSYMSKGDASSWKEEFFETAEQTASQNGGTLDLETYKYLITKITADFSPYDALKDVIYEIKEMRMGGNTSIEEHVSKFKMLVTRSKLEKNDTVIEYFRETLPISLQRNILTLEMPPSTLEKWYEWAVKLQNNYLCMENAIAKTQNQGRLNTSTTKKKNERGPRRFYFEPQKDPNVMDVDSMTTEKRMLLMKKGACFKCEKYGNLVRDCTEEKKVYTPKQTPNTPQKMKGKELHTHVRALLAQMEEANKEEFYNDAAKEGF